MKNHSYVIVQSVLSGLLLMSFLNGCSTSPRRVGTKDRAFIIYWPPPESSQELRLAVKDLIDIKGVVTTAGSEYVAKTGAPASRDAECLEGARRRNVQDCGENQSHRICVWRVRNERILRNPKKSLLMEDAD